MIVPRVSPGQAWSHPLPRLTRAPPWTWMLWHTTQRVPVPSPVAGARSASLFACRPRCRLRRKDLRVVAQHEPDTEHGRDDLGGPAGEERPAGRFGWPRRHRRWVFAFVVVALLAEMAIAMVTTAVEQTPTIDEPGYVGPAAVHLREHSVRYTPEHPPLGKLIIATGLAFADVRLDPAFAGNQSQLGQHVLYESGNDARRLMLLARLPVIVLTLLFGLVV